MQRAPNAKLTRLVDAASEPLSLADAKNFLRVEVDADDDLISSLISAARIDCETEVNRSFITTTWQLELDYFPANSGMISNILPALAFGTGVMGSRSLWLNMESGSIRLPMPPLISVTSVNYINAFGVNSTLDLTPGNIVSISGDTPGQIAPLLGQIFPLCKPQLSAVKIEYTAGYGPDATYVPPTVVTAIRFLTAHYYEHRTDDVPIPRVVSRLLNTVAWGNY
jgi:hypothetical protein